MDKKVTIYATAPSQKGDGEGGVYKPGEAVTVSVKESQVLLSSGRFTDDKDKAKAITDRLKKIQPPQTK